MKLSKPAGLFVVQAERSIRALGPHDPHGPQPLMTTRPHR